VCVSVCLCTCVCVCETSLGGHFRALDQTCKDVFSCEDLFRVLGKSGCMAVFSVLGMHVSVSLRPVLGSEHCSCSVCVCSTVHATARTLDNLCVVRPHLGGYFRALDQTCEDVFLARAFLGRWKMYVSFCESSQQYKNLYVCACMCVCVCAVCRPWSV